MQSTQLSKSPALGLFPLGLFSSVLGQRISDKRNGKVTSWTLSMHKDRMIVIPFTQLEELNWKAHSSCAERQQKYDHDVRDV